MTIEWRNLKSVVEATTSQGSLPSLPNVLLLIAKVRTQQLLPVTYLQVPQALTGAACNEFTQLERTCRN